MNGDEGKFPFVTDKSEILKTEDIVSNVIIELVISVVIEELEKPVTFDTIPYVYKNTEEA